MKKRSAQRHWSRLHKAMMYAPGISSLLLARYLQQGTPWTDAQKQALRKGLQEQGKALTWRTIAAVDLIELGDIFGLFRSFQISLPTEVASFFEKANKVYRRLVFWEGDINDEPLDRVFQFVQQYGGEWQHAPYEKEIYPYVRLMGQLDSDALHQSILRFLSTFSVSAMTTGFHDYFAFTRCLEAVEKLLNYAIQTPNEEMQNALFELLSKLKHPLHDSLEQFVLSLQQASEKVKRLIVPLFVEHTSSEVLHFFWDGVMEQIARHGETVSTYQAEKALERVAMLPLPAVYFAQLREAFVGLPPILQGRLLPKLGEDASAETGELLLRFFFGRSADLRYAASEGLIRYFAHHPVWLGRLVELDGILSQAMEVSADDAFGMSVESLLEAFAKTTGDWRGTFEAGKEQPTQRKRPSLFSQFRGGRGLIARWIGEHRLVAYLPLLRGWFGQEELDLWEKAEIALALGRLKDPCIVPFLIEHLPSLQDDRLFSDPWQNVFLAASALLSTEEGLLRVYKEMAWMPSPVEREIVLSAVELHRSPVARSDSEEETETYQTALLMRLLWMQSLPLEVREESLDLCLAEVFLLLDLFSKPAMCIEREMLYLFLGVLEDVLWDHKDALAQLGEDVCAQFAAYVLSRLRFLPRKPWVQESVDAVTQNLRALCGAEAAFLARQREAYEASLFS